MSNVFMKIVAYRTLNLLVERRAILYEGRRAYYVWTFGDRVLVIFDTSMVDIGKINDKFVHDLSTRLSGRLVVRTNTRGLFLQVDPNTPPALTNMEPRPLELAEQPGPHHMPIGLTERGDHLWRSLIEGDSWFVTDMRGMGKTGELHGMIQALLHGGQTLIYAWDGKDYAEFLRYVGQKNFTLLPTHGLQRGLELLQELVAVRMQRLAMSGKPNIIEYNKTAEPQDQMLPVALIIDEVAEVEDQVLLLKQVKVNRAAGVHPIFATNDPSKSAVIAKSNLGTRISFKVASAPDSMMGLGKTGAQQLPATRGRGLIEHNGRMLQFQSFLVEYPEPTEEGRQWMAKQLELAGKEVTQPVNLDETKKIEELIHQGKSDTAIVAEIWNVTSGGRFTRLIKRVKAIRSNPTAPASPGTSQPVLDPETQTEKEQEVHI